MSMDKQNMISKTNYNSLAKLNSSKILIDKYHFDKKFITYFKCNKVGHKSTNCNMFRSENVKVKASFENASTTYFKCNQIGHKAFECHSKKIGKVIIK